ncbi:MAG: hypothetical protein WKF77_05335 [Planctomycetaceae bacterium]
MKLTTATYDGDSHSMSDFTSLNFRSSRTDWADSNSNDGTTGSGYSWSENENNRHSYSDVTTTDRLVGAFGSSKLKGVRNRFVDTLERFWYF